jgi:hypothetical protein
MHESVAAIDSTADPVGQIRDSIVEPTGSSRALRSQMALGFARDPRVASSALGPPRAKGVVYLVIRGHPSDRPATCSMSPNRTFARPYGVDSIEADVGLPTLTNPGSEDTTRAMAVTLGCATALYQEKISPHWFANGWSRTAAL